jgi:starch phosphorylase
MELRRAADALINKELCAESPSVFANLHESLLRGGDRYFVLADYRPYLQRQKQAAETFSRPEIWTRKSILTVARMGFFSSDRTIREYARDIWQAKPLPIKTEFVKDFAY